MIAHPEGSVEHVFERRSINGNVKVVHERGRGIAWRIWPAAHVLLQHLENSAPLSSDLWVLELGAGVGLVGICCASWGAKKVFLTDLDEALPALKRSVAANEECVSAKVQVCKLAYGDIEALHLLLQDIPIGADLLVVGSDLTYWESLYEPLAITMKEILDVHPKTKILLAHTKRDWGGTEKRFFTKLLSQNGLNVDIVESFIVEERDAEKQHGTAELMKMEKVNDENPEWTTRLYGVSLKAEKASIPNEDTTLDMFHQYKNLKKNQKRKTGK